MFAYALGELEALRLLLGAPFLTCEPRRLQVLAGVDRPIPYRAVRVNRRAVHHPIGCQLARPGRVRELRDSVFAHALRELHRLLAIGGVRVAGVALGAVGSFEQPTPIRATMARAARDIVSSDHAFFLPW